MTTEEKLKLLQAAGIVVNGDLVLEKHVEHEIGNVESGGIGIQLNYYGKEASTQEELPAGFSPIRDSICLTLGNDARRMQFVHKALIHEGFIGKDTELSAFIDVFSGQGTDNRIKWVHKNDKSTLCYFVKQLYVKGYALKDENGNIPWLTIRSRFVNKDGETFPDDIRSQHEPKKLAKTIDNIVELLNSEMNLEDFDDDISELFSDIRNVKEGKYRDDY